MTFIANINRLLLFDSQTESFQFNSKRVFINLLKEAGAESVMDFICTTNDCLCEVVLVHSHSKEMFDRIYRIYKMLSNCGTVPESGATLRYCKQSCKSC